MKEHILTFFKTELPYPTWGNIVNETIFLSIYTFLFLLLFEPFGTFEYRHPYKSFQLAGYGLLVLVFYPLIKKGLLSFFASKPFHSLLVEMMLLISTLLLLTFVAFFYHGLFIKGSVSLRHLPIFTMYSITFWSIPALAISYHRSRLEQKKDVLTPQESTIEITGTNRQENLLFKNEDIYYLKSNGNYVMIYFQKAGAIKHEMIRNTLGQVGSLLPETDFSPIHRSFIANHKNFDSLVRDDGKHFLVNRKLDIRLPVSSNYVRNIENKLRDHR